MPRTIDQKSIPALIAAARNVVEVSESGAINDVGNIQQAIEILKMVLQAVTGTIDDVKV